MILNLLSRTVLVEFRNRLNFAAGNSLYHRSKMNLIRTGLGSNYSTAGGDPPPDSKEPKSYKGVTFDGTMNELKIKLAKTMGVEIGYNPIPKTREYLSKYMPKSQDELPPRSMKDSFIAGLIPLSTSKALQEKYITFLGRVRIGRLLEDMDIFAVMVAQKHILNPKLPPDVPFPQTLVTALVDRIDFTEFIPKPVENIKISGHVSWVGRSSMEVVVWLEQEAHGVWNRITRALFVIAARDPTNTGPALVNSINPADEREKKILSGGESRKKSRQLRQKRHLLKVIPDNEEQRIIHSLYLKTGDPQDANLRRSTLPPNCVWMSHSTISSVVFSHPEDRNLHNTVFGGFIMRQAAELSWVLGYMYSKYRPVLKTMSDINFQRPIYVNSLIQMHAHVVYTKLNYMQMTVYVETYNPTSGRSETTNTFHFTYMAPEVVNECLPLSYIEAMMYIDGRRHFLETMSVEKKQGKDDFHEIILPSKL